MSRRLNTAAAVLLMGATVTMIVAIGPASADNRNTHSHHETMTFHDVTTGSAFVDLGHDGAPDPGDSLVFHEEDRRKGALIEHNDSQCLVALADEYICSVVVVVEGRGQVTLDGSIAAPGGAFPDDFELAVTGGTGDFAGVRGYARAHHVSDAVSDDTLVLTH